MTDLKQNINPETNDSGNANPEAIQNNNLNQLENTEKTESNPNFSEIFSENSDHSMGNEDKKTFFNNDENLSTDTNKLWESLEVQKEKNLQEPIQINNSENLNYAEQSETSTNGIILWKFDNPMINTSLEQQSPQTLDQTLLEHPATLENPWNEEINAEEQQKAKLAQKEKLLQLIKVHESKAQKNWFTKWILSWVVLTACIFVAVCFFAKDQVISLINELWVNQAPLNANIIDLNQNLTDETEKTESDQNTIEDTENTELDENLTDKTENNESDQNTIEDTENTELDENLTDETENTESVQNTIEDTENTELDENLTDETEEAKKYTITHVNSEEEANWVLASHCSDLTCYGEDKEFSPCTSFRLSENLNDNANRIGKNWICKYKDSSELVFVEFIGKKNENNLDNNTTEEKRARDVARKTALSQLQTAIITSQWDKWIWPGMDKGANEWITTSAIENELKEAWMYSAPMDPNIYNINYWLWNNYIDNSALWEYLYLVAKRNWTQNGWFLLMAKTEVEWWSNWIVCKDWTWLNKWYIDNETDIAKIQLCTNVTQWNSCGINEGNCTYTSEDELRYIVLY